MKTTPPTANQSCDGFTLVELLVAMVVSLVLLGILAYTISRSSNDYNRVSNRTNAAVEARAALNTLATDGQTAILAQSFHHKKASGAIWAEDECSFLVSKPASSQDQSKAVGDLCQVYYYTAITEDSPRGEVSRKLFRRLVSSKDVFDQIKNSKGLTSLTPDPTTDEPVAFNVVNFQATPKYRNDSGNIVEWQKTDGHAPEFLDITLTVADKKIAANLRTAPDWQGATALSNKWLGNPADVHKNQYLRTFNSTVSIGHE